MLTFVSVVNIVTMAPYVAFQITYYYLPDPHRTAYNTFIVLQAASRSIPLVNSSVHIFIYYYRSSRFRMVFRSMFFKTSTQ